VNSRRPFPRGWPPVRRGPARRLNPTSCALPSTTGAASLPPMSPRHRRDWHALPATLGPMLRAIRPSLRSTAPSLWQDLLRFQAYRRWTRASERRTRKPNWPALTSVPIGASAPLMAAATRPRRYGVGRRQLRSAALCQAQTGSENRRTRERGGAGAVTAHGGRTRTRGRA
jgi:hypothetical protein